MTCSCKKVGEDFLSIVQSFNQSATMNRLRTRDVPTSSMEFNEIQLFLRNAETVLAGCAEEIQRLKRLREETIRAMSNARALASPIWKLPPEILYETFAVYLGDAQRELELLPSALLIEYHSRLPSPSFCLAQVCTLWRNLIHARPSCWSSIFISMPTILKYPKRLYLLHHCISRSASMPLEFIIAHGNKADDPRDDFLIHSVYNLLLENHPRWRTFTSLVDGAQKWENYIDRWISDEELRQWTSGEEPYGSLNLCSELKVYRAEESLACPSRYNRLFSILTELEI
ncbi:hypothetical protein BT96DRAFT_974444 [Gymnopus androsaceus JB14]|uniref:F-box domain-containing protein n=1 Tax=Gymnopus androsaceus JB14 TaxID=1447944 RepID=A0A6A4HST9_9AGAR|nr:hypothetical protein BT96DRAFT_974444 [Gymnopus androsaceus JB14]